MNHFPDSIGHVWNELCARLSSQAWRDAILIMSVGAYGVLILVLLHDFPVRMGEFYRAERGLQLIAGEKPESDAIFVAPYLEGLFLSWGEDAWGRLMGGRSILAVINGTLFAVGALAMRRYASMGALLIVLPVLLFMRDFVHGMVGFSLALAAGWVGAGVLLALLRGKPALAGMLAALGVVVLPIAILHFLAGGFALLSWVVFGSGGSGTWRGLVGYLVAALAVFSVHLTVFGLLTGAVPDVPRALESLAAIITPRGGSYWLDHHFWMESVWNNLAFWLLTLVALWHFEEERRKNPADSVPWLLASYVFFLLGLGFLRADGQYAWILNAVPVAFVAQVFVVHAHRERRGYLARFGLSGPALLFVALFGVVLPVRGSMRELEEFDAGRQRHTVELADWLLSEGGTYFSGVPMVFTRRPAVDRYAGLGAKERAQLAALSEAEQNALIQEFRAASLKVIIESDRTKKLPPLVDAYFRNQFAPVSGNLRVYAPTVEAETDRFDLAFEGYYQLDATDSVTIDGSTLEPDARVYLTKGPHEVTSEDSTRSPFRLRLAPPELADRLKRRYKKEGPLFP